MAAPSAYREHLVLMSRYHRWAHEVCGRAVLALSAAERSEDAGLVFRSAHGTLNHLLLGDLVWWMRMTGAAEIRLEGGGFSRSFDAMSIRTFWSGPADAWVGATESVEECLALQLAQCDNWDRFIADKTEEELGSKFSYSNTRGEPFEKVLGQMLAHVFNHGTHHRGQVSAALTRFGQPAPVLDLLYYLEPTS